MGDPGSIPGLGRSPGGGHGNPLVFLPGKSAWTGEPGGLQSLGLQRVRHDWATKDSSMMQFISNEHLIDVDRVTKWKGELEGNFLKKVL